MRLILAGSSRNGTTITTQILNKHPDIWLTNEFRIYMSYNKAGYFRQLANKSINSYNMMPPELQSKNFIKECQQVLKSDSIIHKIEAVENVVFGNNWLIFGDKGIHANHIKELTEAGLPFKLILIHRDGRDVVSSGLKYYKKNPKHAKWWRTSSPYKNSLCWVKILGDILQTIESSLAEDCLIIRFEDYIDHPGKISKQISDYLNINEKLLVKAEKSSINPTKSNRGYYKKWCPDWRKTFAPEAIKLLEKLNYI